MMHPAAAGLIASVLQVASAEILCLAIRFWARSCTHTWASVLTAAQAALIEYPCSNLSRKRWLSTT